MTIVAAVETGDVLACEPERSPAGLSGAQGVMPCDGCNLTFPPVTLKRVPLSNPKFADAVLCPGCR